MILLVSPAAQAQVHGNSVTVHRWAGILGSFGYEVRVERHYRPGDYAALVALHARKSAAAVHAFRAGHPRAPVVLALTGTDLYPDLASAGVDPTVTHAASRIVVLQPHAVRELDADLRSRARVIIQSAPPMVPAARRDDVFDVAVLAHLRAVKDPLRAAAATRMLPRGSRVRVTHLGAGLEAGLAAAARAETAANPRYEWLGERSRSDTQDVLARSRLLLLTSRHEGGANVVSEALAAAVPVLSSDIAGSRGLLGDGYPGYFAVGDTAALAQALHGVETDREGLYTELTRRCERLRDMVEPRHETAAWASLLIELSLPSTVHKERKWSDSVCGY